MYLTTFWKWEQSRGRSDQWANVYIKQFTFLKAVETEQEQLADANSDSEKIEIPFNYKSAETQ